MSICSLKQGMYKRFWVIGIPSSLRNDLIEIILKWVNCSGREWTIKRLKSLKVDLFRQKAGLSTLTWVRKNRKGQMFGPIGRLFRLASSSERMFRKMVSCLQVYTIWKFERVTDSQLRKFRAALQTPLGALTATRLDFLSNFSKSIEKSFGNLVVDRSRDNSLLLHQGSPSRKRPVIGQTKTVPQDYSSATELAILDHPVMGNLVSNFFSLCEPVFGSLDRGFRPASPQPVDALQVIGGKLAFLQEAGGKLRTIASPYLFHQLTLQPLGDTLYNLLRCMPWDCTHDQEKPIPFLVSHLVSGRTVHSVDLSSATDLFPWIIQKRMLLALFGDIPDISYMDIICRSQWFTPYGMSRWHRGQPLGLYPSFATFALTHGMLLWFLNGCRHSNSFFVLGDDVVILCDKLHSKYMEFLQEWKCQFSPEKSISSSTICEFAGLVITSSGPFRPLKWREISDDNFVDICRNLGPRSEILLSPRQRKVFNLIKHCSLPMGLNFSYQGSNHTKMWENHERVFSDEKRVSDSRTDHTRVLNKNLFSSSVTLPHRVDTSSAFRANATFVEKVDVILSKLLPWYTSKRRGQLRSVPEGLGETSLPVDAPPSRITSLVRYEKYLPVSQ